MLLGVFSRSKTVPSGRFSVASSVACTVLSWSLCGRYARAMAKSDPTEPTEPTQETIPYLTVPSGKGYTHCGIQRAEQGKWITCEWFSAENQGYQRRVPVLDGQDLQQWILERWGSGKYRLTPYRGNTAGGALAAYEMVSPAHPTQPVRIGSPAASLPTPAGRPASAQGPAAPWVGQVPQLPTWQQMQEMQERAAERERAASAERLAAIRADEDERRARREREDEERRRRDLEDVERRAAQDRARALAELEQLRERHKLDLERSRQEHEMRIRQMEIERERERERSAPSADDFAEALEAAEERILASVAPKEAPKSELMQMIGPHMPIILGALQGLAKAAQQAAARPVVMAPNPGPPQGEPQG